MENNTVNFSFYLVSTNVVSVCIYTQNYTDELELFNDIITVQRKKL